MRACIFCQIRTMQNHYIGEVSICDDCLDELRQLMGVGQGAASPDGEPDALSSVQGGTSGSVPQFTSSAAPMSPEVTASLAQPVSPSVRVVLPKGSSTEVSGSQSIPVPSGLSGNPASVQSSPPSAPSASSAKPANPLAALGRSSGGSKSAAARLVASQPSPGVPAPSPGVPAPSAAPAAANRPPVQQRPATTPSGVPRPPAQQKTAAPSPAANRQPIQRPATTPSGVPRPVEQRTVASPPTQSSPHRQAVPPAPSQPSPGGSAPVKAPGKPSKGGLDLRNLLKND